jgi:hypothetical protein
MPSAFSVSGGGNIPQLAEAVVTAAAAVDAADSARADTVSALESARTAYNTAQEDFRTALQGQNQNAINMTGKAFLDAAGALTSAENADASAAVAQRSARVNLSAAQQALNAATADRLLMPN